MVKSQAELIEELKSKQVELTSALEDKQVQLEAAITDSKVQAAKELSETKVALEQAQDTAKVSLAQDLGDLTSRVHKGEELQVGLAKLLDTLQETIKDDLNTLLVSHREEFEQFHQSNIERSTANELNLTNLNQNIEDKFAKLELKFEQNDLKLEQFNQSSDERFAANQLKFEQNDQKFEQNEVKFEQNNIQFEQKYDAKFEQNDAKFEQNDAKFEQFHKSQVTIEQSSMDRFNANEHNLARLGQKLEDITQTILLNESKKV